VFTVRSPAELEGRQRVDFVEEPRLERPR